MFASNQQNWRRCPNGKMSPQHWVGASSISCSSPVLLARFWDAVGRVAGKKLLPVGYLLLIALNHHQGPELLCMCGWWRNVAIFPFIYSPSWFFLSMQLRELRGNGLGAFSALEPHNMDMCLIVIIHLFRKQKISFPFAKTGLYV